MKLKYKQIKDIAKKCGFNTEFNKMDGTKIFGVHHYHEWDHGYESNGINEASCGYNGPRREFYADMRDMFNFLSDYIKINNIAEFIAAPLFYGTQFIIPRKFCYEKIESIYIEISEFLKKLNINNNSRDGAKLSIRNDIKIIEMLLEGAFLEDISNIRIMFPSQSVVLDFDHHFDIIFFTPNFEKEKKCVINLLKKHTNLRYYERIYG